MDDNTGLSKPLIPKHHKYETEVFDPYEDYNRVPYSDVYPPRASSRAPEADYERDSAQYTAIPFLVRLPALFIALVAAGLGGAIIAWLFSRLEIRLVLIYSRISPVNEGDTIQVLPLFLGITHSQGRWSCWSQASVSFPTAL